MAITTDPANELAAVCKRLSHTGRQVGAVALGTLFGFEGYSTGYYRIISSIMQRADQVEEVVANSHMDPEHKVLAAETLREFKSLFSSTYLNQAWNNGGSSKAASLVQAITFLSPTVRSYVQYPSLDEDEVRAILVEIDEYLRLLRSNSEGELAFVRRSIEDSLQELVFRLTNLGWLGADYTLEGLRQVNDAYHLMERGTFSDDGGSSIMTRLGSLIGAINDRLSTAREWKENAALAIEGYKFVASLSMPVMALTPLLTGPK